MQYLKRFIRIFPSNEALVGSLLQMPVPSWKWITLGVVLYFGTFGIVGIYMVLYVIAVLVG